MRLIETVNRLLGERLCYLYLAAVVITTYEVVLRYVFAAPTSWAFEITILLCAICYLLSGGYVTAQRRHIAITAIFDLAPPRVQWWLELIGMLTGAAAMAILAWAAYGPGLRALRLVERTGSAFNSPSPAIIKPLITLGAALIVLQLLVQLYRHFAEPWHPPGRPLPPE